MPPSPVREVGAGRLLRPGRVLQRPGAKKLAGDDEMWSSTRGYRRRHDAADEQARGPHPPRTGPPSDRERRPAAAPRGVDDEARRTRGSPGWPSTGCGSTTSAAAWSSRKTTCARRTPPPTSRCSITSPRRSSQSKYDLKAVTRLILQSRVYQLSSVPNATNKDDEQYCSHYRVKRLPAEVLLDAICAVTEVPEAFPGRPRGTRADRAVGQPACRRTSSTSSAGSERLSPCECGRSSEPTMAQCLHLMNAPEIERKIAEPERAASRGCSSEEATEEQIVEELCLAALGRPPNEKERRAAKKLFAPGRRARRRRTSCGRC